MSEALTSERKAILESIRGLKRAMQGLSIEEQDIMTFLVNAKDDRERTRLKEHDCYSHSGFEYLADIYPETYGFLKELAEIENIYFISLDGLQRQEAILMTKAKVQSQTPLTIENITNPVETPVSQAPQQTVKGRSLLHPFRKATP